MAEADAHQAAVELRLDHQIVGEAALGPVGRGFARRIGAERVEGQVEGEVGVDGGGAEMAHHIAAQLVAGEDLDLGLVELIGDQVAAGGGVEGLGLAAVFVAGQHQQMRLGLEDRRQREGEHRHQGGGCQQDAEDGASVEERIGEQVVQSERHGGGLRVEGCRLIVWSRRLRPGIVGLLRAGC